MAGLLAGKRLVITGVITDASIAYKVAQIAQNEGAQIVLTGFGRMSLVEKIAKTLPVPPPVIELDVTDPQQLATLPERVGEHLDGVDGILHAIAFATKDALGSDFVSVPWDSVSKVVQVSTWSLAALTNALLPMMSPTASVVGLDFDASKAWPIYGWMGVAKAGLESAARYLALQLGPKGIRVNLVSAGPLRTIAARGIPGFDIFEQAWNERSPLRWDVTDAEPTARACVALMSDWFPATTGEIIHVDGGVHAVGA